MKKLLILLLLALAAGAGYYYWQDNQTPATTYLTEPVQRGNVEKSVIATGSIESTNEVDVGAQVSGKVIKLYVKLGQEVNKGDLIAEIDSTTQVNNLNTKKAQLASYKAQLKAKQTAHTIATTNYNRLAKLYSQKSASQVEMENAKNTLDAAKAEIEALQESIKQAEIEVDTAQTNVGYTKITSPIDGTVISTPISEGQTVNSNQSTPTIVKVANLDKMLIKPEISEGDITKVKAGQAVTFTILSDSRTQYDAVVDSVDPATTTISDNSSSTTTSTSSSASAVYYYANLVVDNPNRVLRIGMTTENSIKIAQANDVLYVSNMALQRQGKAYFVNVLNGQNQPEKREVEIGVQNDFQTEIKSGLNEGEEVIVSQVAAGEKVGSAGRGPRIF
ncbi:efflux transporter periplasmic adaptor subunit [Pasteurellaceae bacterium RH1A]|nr:efflux transporter periplasmic adaptor subunit [Pasteurellaceae bacterium RH1A]